MQSDRVGLAKRLRTVGATVRLLYLSSLPSLPFIAYIERDNPPVTFACFLACAFAGVLLESWPVIGTLAGVGCGFLFQPVRLTTVDAQARSGLEIHLASTALGLFVGCVIGAATRGVPERGSKSKGDTGMGPIRKFSWLRVAIALFLTVAAMCLLAAVFVVPRIHMGPK
jgi:hypothetical protein